METPLRMALLELGTEGARAGMAPFFEALRARSGLSVEPAWFSTYEAMLSAAPTLDLFWAPPLVAIALVAQGLARPILACGRRGGVHYQSALVVRHDSSISRLEELAGKRVAWVSRTSAAGYAVPRLLLQIEGLDPAAMWRSEIFAGTHATALQAVVRRDADVCAVYVAREPDGTAALPTASGEVRVLRSVGPIPADVIAVRAGLDHGAVTALTGGLMSMGDSELSTLAAIAQITAFEPVPVHHLEPLEKLVRLVRSSSRLA